MVTLGGTSSGCDNFNVSDFIFLEESLLPDFDYDALGLTFELGIPMETTLREGDLTSAAGILASRTRHATPTPSPSDALESCREFQTASRVFRAIRCTEEDAGVIRKACTKANNLISSLNTPIPTRSRVSRLLNAYFEFFDPHTPIVHRPNFTIGTTSGMY